MFKGYFEKNRHFLRNLNILVLERVVAKFYMQRLAKDILSHYSILRRRLKYGFCSLYFPLYPESDLSLSL